MKILLHVCASDADARELALIRAQLMLGSDFDFDATDILLLIEGNGVDVFRDSPQTTDRIGELTDLGVHIHVDRESVIKSTIDTGTLPDGVELVPDPESLVDQAKNSNTPVRYLQHV